MNNYEIKTEGRNYTILEKATGYEVFSSNNKRKAYKQLAHFNMGGCFDGWTPSFFLTEIPENYYEEG